ncbi:hypothetical protein [Sinomonas albida]|uniref:hypothetical protein n=1 Tax=Sinomonas albida TaxID=369942 RepID=UPI003017CC94
MDVDRVEGLALALADRGDDLLAALVEGLELVAGHRIVSVGDDERFGHGLDELVVGHSEEDRDG